MTAARWDEAIKQVQSTLKLAPGHGYLLGHPGLVLCRQAHVQEGSGNFSDGIQGGSDREESALCGVASTYAFSDGTAQALDALRRLQTRSENVPGHAYAVAMVYWALAGRDGRNRDDTYSWLDRAYQEHGFELVYSSARWWDGWQSDPRWIALRKKLGLPP